MSQPLYPINSFSLIFHLFILLVAKIKNLIKPHPSSKNKSQYSSPTNLKSRD